MIAADRLESLSRTALEVARSAAGLVLSGWRSGARAKEKAHADLVTEYDLRAERFVRAKLAELTPDVALFGEEEGGSGNPAYPKDEAPTWYCDPIDGTTNFVHGHPFFAVSIGLMAGRSPLAGAVVAPALAAEWRGAVGAGAWRDGAPCRVSSTKRLSDALLATGVHPQGGAGLLALNLQDLGRVLAVARGVRRCGAAALDLCLVADGTYDGYWERMLGPWDTAAGASIVLAAGGMITDLSGGPPDVRKGYLVASNGRVHAELVALLDTDAGSQPGRPH